MQFGCYVIYSQKNNAFYIGETNDFENRLVQHNSGYFNSSSTKHSNDWEIWLFILCKNRVQASLTD